MIGNGPDKLQYRLRTSPFYPDYYFEYENIEGGIEDPPHSYQGVFLNQSGPPLWTPPYYSVQAISQQPVSVDGITHTMYFRGWDYDPGKIELKWPSSLETPIVFKASDAVLSAKYKGTQLSNDSKAYSNSNQRKIVRVHNYTQPTHYFLHAVYESMGHCWYEMSNDNGQTWEIMNDGNPLDQNGGKSPSIDYYYDWVLITWQEKSGDHFTIQLATFEPFGPDLYILNHLAPVAMDDLPYESIDANPVVSTMNTNYGMVIWKGSTGGVINLKYRYGWIVGSPSWFNSGIVPQSDNNSTNPSIFAKKENVPPFNFHLAFQQSNEIYYYKIDWNQPNHQISFIDFAQVSNDNGFSRNYKPSIIGCNNNNDVKICWEAYRKTGAATDGGGGWLPVGETKVFFRSKDNGIWSSFNSYGTGVNSANINRNSDNSFAFAWSEVSPNLNKFVRSDDINSFHTNNTSGGGVQICNYDNLNSMRLNSFSTSTVPYSFKLSNTFNLIPQSEEEVFTDREGIIIDDTTAFYYSFGEITVDSEKVDFKEVPDTIIINNREKLNTYLISEPFNLNDNSLFTYAVQYGVTDSISADESLSGGKYVNFKLELIDNMTNEPISIFDDITFSEGNIIPFAKFVFQINPEGIGNRICLLKLSANDNLNINYALTKDYKDATNLAKTNYIKKSVMGNETVKSYILAQNFPNPFNPATTINYQLPKTGFVTLKIYDILGKEVATLVNEQKTRGRYSVNFDASHLASGVYIYQLRVNDYVSSKKMLLLK